MLPSIFEILRLEVDRASEEYTQSKQNFWHISADIPSGFPHPDGKQRIENAARAQTLAMVNYTRALKRFNAFLMNGTVPEDLLKAPTRDSVRLADPSDEASDET